MIDPEFLVPLAVAVVAILAAVAAFTVAWRRSAGADWKRSLGRETKQADRSMAGVSVREREAVLVGEPASDRPAPTPIELEEAQPEEAQTEEAQPEEAQPEEGERQVVTVASVHRLVEVSPEEAGVTRRSFFNRALGITFLVGFGGTQAISYLAFLWPKLSGGFGSDVNAGSVADLLSQAMNDDGSITPVFVPEAKAYVVPAPAQLSEQFADIPVAAGGVMALFQRCVHLGCRVPWCQTSQGFECPCHGSKYNGVGEYFAGPAPRNLDRFVIEITDTGELIIKTGSRLETPRAFQKSVEYPQGVSCISIVAAEGEA